MQLTREELITEASLKASTPLEKALLAELLLADEELREALE